MWVFAQVPRQARKGHIASEFVARSMHPDLYSLGDGPGTAGCPGNSLRVMVTNHPFVSPRAQIANI